MTMRQSRSIQTLRSTDCVIAIVVSHGRRVVFLNPDDVRFSWLRKVKRESCQPLRGRGACCRAFVVVPSIPPRCAALLSGDKMYWCAGALPTKAIRRRRSLWSSVFSHTGVNIYRTYTRQLIVEYELLLSRKKSEALLPRTCIMHLHLRPFRRPATEASATSSRMPRNFSFVSSNTPYSDLNWAALFAQGWRTRAGHFRTPPCCRIAIWQGVCGTARRNRRQTSSGLTARLSRLSMRQAYIPRLVYANRQCECDRVLDLIVFPCRFCVRDAVGLWNWGDFCSGS